MQVDVPVGFAPTLRKWFEHEAERLAEAVKEGKQHKTDLAWMRSDAELFRALAGQLTEDGSSLDLEDGDRSVMALLQDNLRDAAAEDEWSVVISCAMVLRGMDANADLRLDTQGVQARRSSDPPVH